MTISDEQSKTLIRQRKRFEALGNSLNKASGMRSWFKVLFATTLIFGLPSVVLVSDPLKDATTVTYQMIIFGFRYLLIALVLYLLSKMTPELYTAKNDEDKKLEETGFRDSATNTKEERVIMVRKVMFSILKIIVFLASSVALFLTTSRDNYGYIIGQQVVYLLVVFLVLITSSSWMSMKPDYSPRLGGRLIVLAFVPATFFWGLEVILGFFTLITESRFHYNVLQLSYGLIYPFVFLFLVAAVLYTTRKTKREKMTLQNAKVAEFDRKSSFISEKNVFSQTIYHLKIRWNSMMQKIFKKEPKKVDLDKRPNLTIVKSIWLVLFITVIPFAFFIPWNLFPQDGLVLFGALIISYQFSMVKYERRDIDVISEPDKDEAIKPLEIRTQELTNKTLRLIILPTMIFIIAQFLLNGILSSGETGEANLVVMGFTWVSALLVIPISIQIMYNITKVLNQDRTLNNSRMFITNLIYILLFELVLYIGTVVALFAAKEGFDFDLIELVALGIQATFVVVLVIIPILYQIIAFKVKDKGFKILKWSTLSLVGLANAGIIAGFFIFVLTTFFN